MNANSSDTWDLIVLGAGAVGENVADYATKGGLRTVIVEAELVGGECSYWACMPSKALLRPATVRLAAQRVAGASAAVTGDLDVAAVLERRTGFTSAWNDESQVSWLDSAGIDFVRGHGRLVGERIVDVTQADGTVRRLTATHAVAVCTGSVPTIPPIEGLADAKPWTSREATSVTDVPGSVAILGGGVVAAELATIYRSLGADVTVILRSRFLSRLEDFASDRVRASLEESGVHFVTASPSSVTRAEDGRVHIALGPDTGPVIADEIIVATGRHSATTGLGLEDVGVSPTDLRVDDSMRVAGVHGGWLYAVGDVNGRAFYTHQGKYQARAAGLAIAARAAGTLPSDPSARPEPWSDHAATADHAHVPSVVFTEPEVATIGLTSAAAEKAGLPVRVDRLRPRLRVRRRGALRRLHRLRPRRHRHRTPGHRGDDVRRPGRLGAAARRDHRHRRRGAAGSAVARRPRLPDDERGLAPHPRDRAVRVGLVLRRAPLDRCKCGHACVTARCASTSPDEETAVSGLMKAVVLVRFGGADASSFATFPYRASDHAGYGYAFMRPPSAQCTCDECGERSGGLHLAALASRNSGCESLRGPYESYASANQLFARDRGVLGQRRDEEVDVRSQHLLQHGLAVRVSSQGGGHRLLPGAEGSRGGPRLLGHSPRQWLSCVTCICHHCVGSSVPG